MSAAAAALRRNLQARATGVQAISSTRVLPATPLSVAYTLYGMPSSGARTTATQPRVAKRSLASTSIASLIPGISVKRARSSRACWCMRTPPNTAPTVAAMTLGRTDRGRLRPIHVSRMSGTSQKRVASA
jgi:hypothetical protein